MNNTQDIERAVIGAILSEAENSRARPYLRDISPYYFENDKLRTVFEVARKLDDEGTSPTMRNLSLSGRLPSDLTGTDLTELVITHTGFEGHAMLTRRLIESYGLREMRRLARDAMKADADIFDLLKTTEAVTSDIGRAITGVGMISKEDEVDAVDRYFEDKKAGLIRLIPTPWTSVNQALKGGLSDSGLSYLVAPGGFGKTSLVLAIAIKAARSGFSTRFLQGEMTNTQMHRRCCLITHGADPETDTKAWSTWVREYLSLPFRIQILTDRTPGRVLRECERAAAEGAKLVVLDYLQVFSELPEERLVDSSKEFLAIRHLSRKLRQFALRSGMHIMAISSRNRNEDGRMKPGLSSLYGGTALEHDPSEAFMLRRYTDTLTEPKDAGKKARMEVQEQSTGVSRMILDILKARDAITGPLPFTYNKRLQTFTSGYNERISEQIPEGTL